MTKAKIRGSGDEANRSRLRVDRAKPDRVRRLLGSASDSDAIDQALDIVLFREDLIAGISAIAVTGGVDDPFIDDREPWAAHRARPTV